MVYLAKIAWFAEIDVAHLSKWPSDHKIYGTQENATFSGWVGGKS